MAETKAVMRWLERLNEMVPCLPEPLECVLDGSKASLVDENAFEEDGSFVQFLQLQASAWLWKRMMYALGPPHEVSDMSDRSHTALTRCQRRGRQRDCHADHWPAGITRKTAKSEGGEVLSHPSHHSCAVSARVECIRGSSA